VRSVCVFCGGSAGEDPRYVEAASRLGRLLASEGLGLVYGGSRVGLMGCLAQAALDAGGVVVGIIPGALMNREVAHHDLTDLRIVGSMHARKSEMVDISDAFIALPGGLGTLEGFCEILTWAQLGFHGKPCGILDVGGYYKPLVGFLDHMVREGFLSESHRAMVVVEAEPEALLGRLRAYEAPLVHQWIGAGQT
jgi:hypothetical protein